MEGAASDFKLLPLLQAAGAFHASPFVLIDVGCGGGLDPAWRQFGKDLIAHGFDLQVEECERLQREETLPGVTYHAAQVGLPPEHDFLLRKAEALKKSPACQIWNRLSTARAIELQPEGNQNRWTQAARLAGPETLIGVSDFVRRERLENVDALKVDVDGPDLEVLVSAEETLDTANVLAVVIECNYWGSADDTSHTFANTDRLLRRHGFELFSLSIRHYSRKALPAPFAFEMFAQTKSGQPIQGDTAYIRDLAGPGGTGLADRLDDSKLAKAACLFEMFRVPDCAAELIEKYSARFAAFGNPAEMLQALTPPLQGKTLTYSEYLSSFEHNPADFLPSKQDSRSVPSQLPGGRILKLWLQRILRS